jgi:hypothetical protein
MERDSPPPDRTALSVQLLDVAWQPRPGIVVDLLKTYGWGLGSEYVYCYSYPTHLEIAQLKGEERFRLKIGSAKGDPLLRIFAQFANNKTAISDSLTVLLIFRTIYASHLERWLHARLERASGSVGSEWYITNPDELIALFREYVRTASMPSNEVAQHSDPAPNPKPRKPSSLAQRKPALSDDSETIPETKNQQGRRVQAVMNSGQFTPEEIAAKTGLSLRRVWGHVNYEIGKLRAELNGNGQVIVLKRPRYRME